MKTAGIIANPASGKDIRRLVGHGSVFDNQEKVRIVRRLLLGLEEAGVEKVVYMPDGYGIVPRALDGVQVNMQVEPLQGLELDNCQDDSSLSGEAMQQMGVACIMVLGGDGTNRAVMKGNRDVPILPISTGTNNVFPYMVEATIAGLAAGLITTEKVSRQEGCFRSSCLHIMVNGKYRDLALVDVAVYNDIFIASRAVWDMKKVDQLFLTRCRPDNIGLSAIGGQLLSIKPQEPKGLYLELGDSKNKSQIKAAIGPGMIANLDISCQQIIRPEQEVKVRPGACVLALDGEREVEIGENDTATVKLSSEGPFVVDIKQTMYQAQQRKLLWSKS